MKPSDSRFWLTELHLRLRLSANTTVPFHVKCVVFGQSSACCSTSNRKMWPLCVNFILFCGLVMRYPHITQTKGMISNQVTEKSRLNVKKKPFILHPLRREKYLFSYRVIAVPPDAVLCV